MSLLAVGSVAFDDLETPAGHREDVLGGSASYFSLSASHFNPVQVVAVVGDDFTGEHRAVFEGRDIDLAGLSVRPGRSFHWKGRYGQDMNEAVTLDTQLNVFAEFHPDLPPSFREAEHLFLGNIDPVLQLEVLHQLAKRPKWVALDTMNYWINGVPEALARALREVDILLINEGECRALSGERNLLLGFERIRSMGPGILVVKRGEYGCLLVTEEGCFACPAFPLKDVVDPTGAGDTFAGGFLGYLAANAILDLPHLKRAVVAGTVMASFTVEGFGLERLRRVNGMDVANRMDQFFSMIRVDGI